MPKIKPFAETEEARSVTDHAVSTLIKNLVSIGIIMETDDNFSLLMLRLRLDGTVDQKCLVAPDEVEKNGDRQHKNAALSQAWLPL
ncbi:MAG: hypothetical protein QXR42_05575 [Candidatus Bathyarchaeia archaeon]